MQAHLGEAARLGDHNLFQFRKISREAGDLSEIL